MAQPSDPATSLQRPRLTPHRALPTAAYRPGHGERPASEFPSDLPCPQGDQWRECEPFLRGIDLYNHGFPWEAHEVWEGLWHSARRSTELVREAALLRGLIQLAAAAVLARDARLEGARRVAQRAHHNLERAGTAPLLGLDPVELARTARDLCANPRAAHPPLHPTAAT